MPTKSKSQTTTDRVVGRRLPRKRSPTHPGEMLFEEFVKPLELTQTELARRLGVSYPRLNEIIKGRRSVTPDTALRLSRVLGMSADFWLGLQQDWDLWHAMNSPEAKEICRLRPIPLGEKKSHNNLFQRSAKNRAR
ncbi:MAG: HigA family addiction module antidote protein [Deltaproteobacteria bacterium]|nr:HigA family addiction module antidote protein [Deltaproteobacteria bacterium]